MKKEMSLAISFRKFFIYNLLTFGLYSTIWSYRLFRFFYEQNNSNYKGKTGPLIKAFFLIFFIQDLFKLSVYEHKNTEPKHNIKLINISAFLVILMILGSFFLTMMGRINPYFLAESSNIVISLVALLGSLLTIGSFYFFKKPIENFQIYFKDFEKDKDIKDRKLHWWEILLSIRGIIGWILTITTIVSLLIV